MAYFGGGRTTGPGFVGAERGDIRITVYRRAVGLLGPRFDAPLRLDGQSERDDNPSVQSCQIQSAMGQPAGFQITLKLPPDKEPFGLFDDDDWVDIEMGRNGTYFHVMRGMIDEVRLATNASGSGATSRSILIAGQSFQKLWAQTPMWFSSIYAQQLNVPGQQLSAKNASILGIGLNVPNTIAAFLYTYTSRVAQAGRSSVAMPLSMPGVTQNFSSSWRQDNSEFDDSDAPRVNMLASMFSPSQSVWDAATGWSDPYFVEMFTALLPRVVGVPSSGPSLGDAFPQTVNGTSAIAALGPEYQFASQGLPAGQAVMTLVVRNKPFINIDPENSARLGYLSPWFSLPLLTLSPQDVVSVDSGRNGYERVNAFFTSSQMLSITGETPVDAKTIPTWNIPDMTQHGMRIMSCTSNYIPITPRLSPGLTPLSTALRLRARLRDHNMANSAYFNGTITLGRSAPEAQIGTRVLVRGDTETQNLTAYIEGVSHRFDAQSGWKTSLTFTRGYTGSDSSHLTRLQALRAQYTEPLY
jgi:hypothetical protein